jgi:hypothetical protein
VDTKQHILDAANVLINDQDASGLFQQLLDVLLLPDKYKVKLDGAASVLNPLLRLAREDNVKFSRVIDMVELRRSARGMTALRPDPSEKKFDKNEYQRKLMAERRVRMVKAAELENLRRPPSGQLIGHARMDFQRVQQNKWSNQLATCITNQLGTGPISKEARAKVAETFWDSVDGQLADDEAAVLRWIQTGRKGPAP